MASNLVIYQVNPDGTIQKVSGEVHVPYVVSGSGYFFTDGGESGFLSDLVGKVNSVFDFAGNTAVDLPKLTPVIHEVSGYIGTIDDVTKAVHNIMASRFLESSMAISGAVGGGLLGGYFGMAANAATYSSPFLRGASIVGSFVFGSWLGSEGAENMAYETWIRNAAPNLANNLNLEPSVIINGSKYYVLSLPTESGVPRTIVYTDIGNADPLSFPYKYMPVTDQAITNLVIGTTMSNAGIDPNISPEQWNVQHGMSASGYQMNTTHYQGIGNGQYVQISTFRDDAGDAMEVRITGYMIGGQFYATQPPEIVGMNASGTVLNSFSPSDINGAVPLAGYPSYDQQINNQANNLAPDGSQIGIIQTDIGGGKFIWVSEATGFAKVTYGIENAPTTEKHYNQSGQVIRSIDYIQDADGKTYKLEKIYDSSKNPIPNILISRPNVDGILTADYDENTISVNIVVNNGVPTSEIGMANTYDMTTGELIGTTKVYHGSDYGDLTGMLSTIDFLSSSVDSEDNVFSNNSSKSKYGTIAGIRQATGTLSAGEEWGGKTFANASSNLGSYLGNVNFVDPSIAYQTALTSSFYFNTNFGSYIPPINYSPGANVYIGIITPYFYYGNPVVLDLNQNGVELISLDESRALYDMSGTGFRQRTAWVAPSDALLAIDYNNDGVIKERKEINFVDWANNSNLTDMEALALAFDSNKDGKLDSADVDFLKFRVWQDKNADGVSDANELQTLTQAGISSIDLNTTKTNLSSGVTNIFGLGTYTKLNGSTGLLADTAFGYESAGWKTSILNGIQRIISENGDVYGVANSANNFVVNLNTEGLNGAIGGAGADSMSTSGAAAVFMQGNAGNDSLIGGDGDDWLEGGTGSDTISGGAGDDTIIVNAEDNLTNISGGVGFDIIAFEGDAGFNMQLNLANGFESAIGGDGNDNITVQTSYQIPRYWVRGNPGLNQPTGWADIPLLSSYVLAGGDGNDVLTAGYGNDILDGGRGNDTLYGDWGNDTYLFGFGSGKDLISEVYARELTIGAQQYMNTGVFPTLYDGPVGPGVKDDNYSWNKTLGPSNNGLNNQLRNSDTIRMGLGVLVSDVVIEKKNLPTSLDLLIGLKSDKAFTSVTQLDDYITVINGQSELRKVEAIEFSDGKKLNVDNWLQGNLTSNANDTLTGNASDNVLNGLSGADRMSGGAGNDIYVVDDINDVVVEGENQGIDTVETSVTLSAELYANVENLTLVATGHINGTGNSISNVITGNAGNNILNGGAGNDTLRGGDGNDLLDGGVGGDVLNGGYGDDIYVIDSATDIIEADQGGNDTVIVKYITGTYTLASDLEDIALSGTANINGTGNALNNKIMGNTANNVLDGGTGNDTLIGGLGNDTYIIDSELDEIIEGSAAGVDAVLSSVTYTLGNNVENLTLSGTSNINGYGNALSNVITGNDASNQLSGGMGNDTLQGAGGSDVYIVGQLLENWESYTESQVPEDVIVENGPLNSDVDVLKLAIDSSHLSTVDFYRSGEDLLIYSHKEYDTDMGGDDGLYKRVRLQDYFLGNQYKVEKIQYSDGVEKNITDMLLQQGYRFNGTNGNDVMNSTGAAVAKLIYGGSGNDLVVGGVGSNIIFGESGDDTLAGGVGNDTLYGGAGNDTYLFSRGDGFDQIEDEEYFTGGGGSEIQTIIVNANSADVRLTRNSYFSYSSTQLPLSSSLIVEFINSSSDRLTFTKWWSNQSSNANRKIIFNDRTLYLNDIDQVLEIKAATSSADVRDGSSRGDTIYGLAGNDQLIGYAGDDVLFGDAGHDILFGGEGNDSLYGGDGSDTLNGGSGADYLDGGVGNNIYYVDNAEDVVIGSGTIYSDALTYSLSNNAQLYKVYIKNGFNIIGDDEVNSVIGNNNSNFISGKGGIDYLQSGSAGFDILQGGSGNDSLERVANWWDVGSPVGNALLDGGSDHDILYSQSFGREQDVSSDVLIGGTGNDIIYAGVYEESWVDDGYVVPEIYGATGNDVILFNAGDGQDVVYAGEGAKLTLSLGQLTRYPVLNLTKTGDDLVLGFGATDKITFNNWYGDSFGRTKSVANLQIIAESLIGFNSNSADTIRNNKVETFNFIDLVARFDTAGSPEKWALSDSIMRQHLINGSDDQAIGGDFAYQYGRNGSLAGMGVNASQGVLSNSNFGTVAQTFSTNLIGASEAIKLS